MTNLANASPRELEAYAQLLRLLQDLSPAQRNRIVGWAIARWELWPQPYAAEEELPAGLEDET